MIHPERFTREKQRPETLCLLQASIKSGNMFYLDFMILLSTVLAGNVYISSFSLRQHLYFNFTWLLQKFGGVICVYSWCQQTLIFHQAINLDSYKDRIDREIKAKQIVYFAVLKMQSLWSISLHHPGSWETNKVSR